MEPADSQVIGWGWMTSLKVRCLSRALNSWKEITAALADGSHIWRIVTRVDLDKNHSLEVCLGEHPVAMVRVLMSFSPLARAARVKSE